MFDYFSPYLYMVNGIKIIGIFLSFACMSVIGCTEYRISKQLSQFSREIVCIPKDLQKIDNQVLTETEDVGNIPVFVFYHDSLACSYCQISYLPALTCLYELSDSIGTFKVMSIFSPRKEEYDWLVKALMYSSFEYPVYIDYTNSFRKTNTCIPDDVRFHSFLLDEERHPIYVGDPIVSEDLFEIFMDVLESLD